MEGEVMKHIISFVIKFVLWSTVLLSFLTIFNTPISLIFFISLAATVISYVLGDLLILPRMGNFVATLADLVLSFGLIWFFCYWLIERTANMAYVAFFATLAIGAAEAFFHLFLENHLFTDRTMRQTRNWFDEGRWATEFAEEYEEPKQNDDSQ
jgi:hypothetical protein